jgi:hypothetical protein
VNACVSFAPFPESPLSCFGSPYRKKWPRQFSIKSFPVSKKNILSKDKIDNNTVRITFDAADGERTYEYKGSSARAINRGKDPASLTGGRLVEHKKGK